MALASNPPMGMEVELYDYQPIIQTPKKRTTPVNDHHVSGVKRLKTSSGAYVERRHDNIQCFNPEFIIKLQTQTLHLRQQTRDRSQSAATALKSNARAATGGCQNGTSQPETVPSVEQEKESPKRHQQQQAGDKPEEQSHAAQDRVDTIAGGCYTAESQPEEPPSEVEQLKAMLLSEQSAREAAESQLAGLEDKLSAESKKRRDVTSQLHGSTQKVTRLWQRLHRENNARKTAQAQVSHFKELYQTESADYQKVASLVDGLNKQVHEQQRMLYQQSLDRDTTANSHKEQLKTAVKNHEGLVAQAIALVQEEAEKLHKDQLSQKLRGKDEELSRRLNRVKEEHNNAMNAKVAEIEELRKARKEDAKLIEKMAGEMEKKDKKLAQIEPLQRQLNEAQASMQGSTKEIADLRTQLAEEQKEHAFAQSELEKKEGQLKEAEKTLEEWLHDRDAARAGEAKANSEIKTLKNEREAADEDHAMELEEVEGRLQDCQTDLKHANALVKQCSEDNQRRIANLERIQALRKILAEKEKAIAGSAKSMSGHGGHSKAGKEPRSVQTIGKTGNMESRVLSRTGVEKTKKQSKKGANGPTTSKLRNPAVTADLYKLRSKGDLWTKKEAGLDAFLDKATDFDTLIKGAKGLGFGLQGEDDVLEVVDEVSDTEAIDLESASRELEDARDAYAKSVLDPTSKISGSIEIADGAQADGADPDDDEAEHDGQIIESMDYVKEEGDQSDDELSEHDDDEFPLEEVANATLDSFY